MRVNKNKQISTAVRVVEGWFDVLTLPIENGISWRMLDECLY